MEDGAPEISERELAEKITFLHINMGLGFRKVAKELASEGIQVSKDKAHRLYHKYTATQKINTEQELTDEETELLDQNIRERERTVKLAKTKDEKRRRFATLIVLEYDASFERRRELFQNKAALLDFTKKVMPITNPALWLRLTNSCALEKIDLAEVIQDAIGNQADYEEVRMEYKKERRDYLLDEYLCLCIEDWFLQHQEEEDEEENEDSMENGSVDKYGGYHKDGWYHIPIPREPP